MNSRNMPEEEELDNMFRQAADLYQPEFDPQAWQEMEKKLDAANRPKSAFAKWGKRALLLLLLVGSGLLVYYYAHREPGQSKAKNTADKLGTPAPGSTLEPVTAAKPATNTKQPSLTHSSNLSGAKEFSTALPAAETKTGRPAQGRRVDSVLPAPRRADNTVRSQEKTGQANKTTVLDYSPAQVTSVNSAHNSVKSTSPVLRSAAGTPLPDTVGTRAGLPVTDADSTTNVITGPKSEEVDKNVAKLPDSIQVKAVVDSAVKKLRPRLLTKLGVTLLLGPDFSTVGFVRPEKASTNVGVLLSYHINSRWTISTGLVRARKVYGAKPEDYHPGDNYWKGQHLPDDINAVCKVLDIPLNVRYALVALPRQAVYVQTGISSYVMLHEDYRYDYENYGKPYSRHWIVANKNQHFFRVLNVSAGYNRQIKPGIWVGAEPFVKIPLAGVGAGKVNLTSMGAFFILNYRFR